MAVAAEFRTNPLTAAALASPFTGPDAHPAEAFTRENVERILALG